MRRRNSIGLLLSSLMFFACQAERDAAPTQADVPDWARQAVWYQIFPERFYNGNPQNDPQLEDIKGSWPHDLTSPYRVSNWTGDWYALQPWESPDKGFYHHVQRRRYGGDLEGVLHKLDYLQDLGITAIYFNPLFESPSLHKYDAAYYHHIDDNFGPNPQRDRQIIAAETPGDPTTWRWTTADSLFLRLIAACHQRGMRVVIDGVFNHVGLNFWAFRDVQRYQQDSQYADWFVIRHWDDPATPENEFDYAGWAGVRELPELRENENGLVPGVRDHIFAAVRRWMDPDGDGDPSDGIDGWRLDVAEKVSRAFWRDFRAFVRSINPEAYLVGEIFWEDWSENKMFNARPWLEGDVFDAVMNYRWAKEVVHFFIDQENKISASEFDRRLRALREDYPREVNDVLMNLMDSHDTDRLPSQIVNPDGPYDHDDSPKDDPDYRVRKPTAEERRVQKLIATFQMSYLGAPMIYYGDEAGMWGADDPDCRKPMLWEEFDYAVEKSHPFGKSRPADQNRFDPDLFGHYQKLIAIRRSHPALQIGDFQTVLTDDVNDVYAFARTHDGERLVVVLNNSTRKQSVIFTQPEMLDQPQWQDLLSERVFDSGPDQLIVPVSPKTGLILQGQEEVS